MERKELADKIIELEWEMFTNTNNAGGRASCQDDKQTFMVMRKAQANIWSKETLSGYLQDLEDASRKQMNLMTIKYARMMKLTFPDEYNAIKEKLPQVSAHSLELADEIMKYHSKWSKEAADKYPKLCSLGRPVTSSGKNSQYAAIDNYLHSELLTYSEATLELCLKDTLKAASAGVNLSLEILKNTAESYGFNSLDAIESALSKKK
jgi:hypothetical protein